MVCPEGYGSPTLRAQSRFGHFNAGQHCQAHGAVVNAGTSLDSNLPSHNFFLLFCLWGFASFLQWQET